MATLSKIELLGDEYLVEFVNDTVSFYLRNVRSPFLSKYATTLQGAHNIVPLREFIVDLVQLALRKSHKDAALDAYKSVVLDRFTQEGLDTSTKTVDILAASIFARREELRKVLTAQVLERTADKTLIDYNFNVEL